MDFNHGKLEKIKNRLVAVRQEGKVLQLELTRVTDRLRSLNSEEVKLIDESHIMLSKYLSPLEER